MHHVAGRPGPDPVGHGKRLIADGTPARVFELVSTQATSSRNVLDPYEVVGPLKTRQVGSATRRRLRVVWSKGAPQTECESRR